MKKEVMCYVCDEPINKENQTYEHIVLNAIGGKLASTKLFCSDCNIKITSLMDAELASQLNLLSNFLMVHRHRSGTPPPVKGGKTKAGEEYQIINGTKTVLSKPIIKQEQEKNQVKFSATTTSDKQMLQILKSIKRKNPEFDVDKTFAEVVRKNSYMNEAIKFNTTVGGDLALKSVFKSALNFFIYNGGNKKFIKHLLPYLLNKENLFVVAHYLEESLPYKYEQDEVNHIIHLVGNPQERILYCYVEYYSSYSFIVKLNDEYDGEVIQYTYCFDVNSNCKLDKEIALNLSRTEYQKIDAIQEEFYKYLQERLIRVMKIIRKKHILIENHRLIEESMNIVESRYPEAKGITKEMLPEIINEISIRAANFIHHLNNKNEKTI